MSNELRFTYAPDSASGIDFLATSYVDGRIPDAFDAKLDAATNAAACREEARYLAMEHPADAEPKEELEYLTKFHDLMARAMALDAFVHDLS